MNALISKTYRERLWISRWVSLLFFSFIGFFSALVMVQLFWGIPKGDNPVYTGILFGLDVVFIILYMNFIRLEIDIDPDRVEVKYGAIKKVIPIREIVSCETTKSKFKVYGGVGIRVGIDGSIAFTTSFGNAVKIVRKTGRSIVFSTNRPTDVSKLINNLIKRGA